MSSVSYIREKVKEEFGLEMKQYKLMHLLHHHLGMQYKKVKPISWKANDPKNLILRQQFAKKFLDLDLKKKVIINLDETWIGATDFRRRKWCPKGHLNSVPKKQV